MAKNSFVAEVTFKNVAKFTGKHACKSLFFNKVAGLRIATLLKKTLAQVFYCEFCEISKNIFSYRTPLVAASENGLCSRRMKVIFGLRTRSNILLWK